jgi:hypothetical protein
MIICGLLSRRHSLGIFNDISYSSVRAFSIATRAKHPVQAEACHVEPGYVRRRPIPLVCQGWVVPLAVPCALLSPPQICRTGTAPAWRPAMTLPPERDQLFISYSHVDRGWVERLQMRNLTPAYYNQTVS